MFTITIHFFNQRTIEIFRATYEMQEMLNSYHEDGIIRQFTHGRSTYSIDFGKVQHIVSWNDENGGRPL